MPDLRQKPARAGFGCRSLCVDGPYCRTRRQNARVTLHREVLYPWHPWFGLTVHVHEIVEKGASCILRCSVDGSASGRRLELPAWMFDRVVCLSIRVVHSPSVDLTALEKLRNLLIERRQSPSAIVAAVSGAQRGRRHQNRRSADAQPAPRFEETAASSRPIRPFRRATARAAMAALLPSTRLAVTELMVRLLSQQGQSVRLTAGGERSDD